ncbi:hypothetical protein C9I43_03755 [Shewanella morhuae]|uniref:Uncharacterized protein n=1 Tax=Shewanella morhuae TaxID=365591 RepID=A0A1N6TP98_9GAMM|nr:hypothetical protein [Shewanella morhuae]PTA49705.1 hypothetical protein C9I43_03755 [Shewanella morhuae]SIQ54906.1 hypothetical protein SAMN05421840_10279 [Shewanella morhuae]SUI62505.1 Uncharacterised protein [Shewanella morhuae]
MRQSARQKHLKQHYKTIQTRRKNYFHSAQQNLASRLVLSSGSSTLAVMMPETTQTPQHSD